MVHEKTLAFPPPVEPGPRYQPLPPKAGRRASWLGLGFGAAILRTLFASFSMALFHYLVIPFYGLRPAWGELFLFYLGINLFSAALVGVLLRNFPRIVLGKMVAFSLVASLFVAYAHFISGDRIASDLFFPVVPTAANISQAFMIFTLLGILSSILVRSLFKR